MYRRRPLELLAYHCIVCISPALYQRWFAIRNALLFGLPLDVLIYGQVLKIDGLAVVAEALPSLSTAKPSAGGVFAKDEEQMSIEVWASASH